MRGKAELRQLALLDVGITPACAGKRDSKGKKRQTTGDHPRVCGEKRAAQHYRARNVGSPPRVRGKDGIDGWILKGDRITPACAGKRLKKS